jgi:hypothetical protein
MAFGGFLASAPGYAQAPTSAERNTTVSADSDGPVAQAEWHFFGWYDTQSQCQNVGVLGVHQGRWQNYQCSWQLGPWLLAVYY